MTKNEFNMILRRKLSGLSNEDIERSIEYYNEMVDDRIDDGLSEEDAVSQVGSLDEIVSEILTDTSLSKIIKGRVSNRRSLRVWQIILIVIGSPLWLSILIAIAAVILAVYIVLWAVVITFYATALSFAAGGIAGIAALILFVWKGYVIQGIFMAAAGLVCAGFSILVFFASNRIAKYVAILGKKILIGIKCCFVGKGCIQ